MVCDLPESKLLITSTLSGRGLLAAKLVMTVTVCPRLAIAWDSHHVWSPIPSNWGGKAPEINASLIRRITAQAAGFP
jgi:hypothetical protein